MSSKLPQGVRLSSALHLPGSTAVCQCTPMAAGRLMLQQLKQNHLPRALAFANDHLAAGACLEALDMGIRLPGQLALLGYGDFSISQQLGGGISTMATPRYQIGQVTGQSILQLLGLMTIGPDPAAGLPNLTPRLVVRNTTVHGTDYPPKAKSGIWEPASSPA